mgnify:CR=1 FL=1
MMEKKPIKRAAVLHDMCSVGRAAMTNILPVLSVMGVEACPVPTMLLSTHTGGYGRPVMCPVPEFPRECASHLKSQGIKFDALFVGYMGNAQVTDSVLGFMSTYSDAMVIFDPIMADNGRYYQNFGESYKRQLQKLLKYSDIITPNFTESCFLADEPYTDRCGQSELLSVCWRLEELGSRRIVITSVPLEGCSLGIAVYEEGELEIFPKEPAGRFYHGTGDLFAAVLLGRILQGRALVPAALSAHEFVSLCIRKSDEYDYDIREGILLEPCLKYLMQEIL